MRGLCEDDDPGIFGYFPSLESTSPGGEISLEGGHRPPLRILMTRSKNIYAAGG